MRFSEALEHVYCGERIYRAGWNGKNMYVFKGRCSPNEIQGAPLTVSAPDCEFLCMLNAKGHIVVGWHPKKTCWRMTGTSYADRRATRMYAVRFYGRKDGALGLCYHQGITIDRKELPDDFERLAHDEQLEQIRLAIYSRRFEHVSGVTFTCKETK